MSSESDNVKTVKLKRAVRLYGGDILAGGSKVAVRSVLRDRQGNKWYLVTEADLLHARDAIET